MALLPPSIIITEDDKTKNDENESDNEMCSSDEESDTESQD